MSIKRITAIVFIYLFACAGWLVLGTATELRSTNASSQLGGKVEGLYGKQLAQTAPSFEVLPAASPADAPADPGTNAAPTPSRWLMPSSNEISVGLATDYRRKGLIWYPTYRCTFDGRYTITNTDQAPMRVQMHFEFPASGGTYDNFAMNLDNQPLNLPIDTQKGVSDQFDLAPGQSRTFHVHYDARGMTLWQYRLDENIGRVQNLAMQVDLNTPDYDYPEEGWSATTVSPTANGVRLVWSTSDLITDQQIGIIIPEKLNPGPLTTRITFFAPVCLLFFFVMVATINILYKIPIHPMHYLFVAAGFFAFHLLLSYLVGVLNVHASFIISALVSVFLVTTYLSAALKQQFPWKIAVAGQLFFLVLFSYSFFLKGITGLTVAIGSVVTLAVLMRVTADVDWNEVFRKPEKPRRGKPDPEPPLFGPFAEGMDPAS